MVRKRKAPEPEIEPYVELPKRRIIDVNRVDLERAGLAGVCSTEVAGCKM